MDKSFKKTIVGLIILSVIMFALGMVLFNTVLSKWYFPFFPVLILFFLLINSVFFVSFHKSLKKSSSQFIRSFMVATGVKLVIYMIFILAYVFSSPKTAVPFAITLSALYILYSAYDLYIMLTLMKRKKEINTLPNQLSN